MTDNRSGTVVLVAEDDEDDRLLTTEAWEEARPDDHLVFVTDGEELLEYLTECSSPHTGVAPAYPDLLLLDLNMPRLDGLSALRVIKQGSDWSSLPVVVLSTSRSASDIAASYSLGANSFISKPGSYADFVEIISTLGEYWLGVVALPTSVGE